MMDAAEILEGIRYFNEDVLPKAYCLSDWNDESISSALMWADFCEQIHKKFVNSQIAKELDERIHQFPTKSNTTRCFDDLRYCSSQLCQGFFQNPTVEKTFFENILLKVKPAYLNIQEVREDSVLLDTLCSGLIEALKPITIVNSDRSLYYEVKAEMFLKFLKDVTLQLSTEDQSETELSLAFENLFQSPETMMVIAHVLTYNSQEGSGDFSEIQTFGINSVLLKLLEDPHCPLAHFLWTLPPPRLRAIALKYASFHSVYLDFLIKSAESLRLEYVNGGERKWNKRISAKEVTLSYEEVVGHFRALSSIKDDLCRATQEYMASLTNTKSDSLIWRDIFSSLAGSLAEM